jgi:hypothetical protein
VRSSPFVLGRTWSTSHAARLQVIAVPGPEIPPEADAQALADTVLESLGQLAEKTAADSGDAVATVPLDLDRAAVPHPGASDLHHLSGSRTARRSTSPGSPITWAWPLPPEARPGMGRVEVTAVPKKGSRRSFDYVVLERETGFEPATSTLARLRSTE